MDQIPDLDTPTLLEATEPAAAVTQPSDDQPAVTTDEYAVAHGERLTTTLDLDTWLPGADLVEMQERIHQEISDALDQEKETERHIREQIFPVLRERGVPDGGVYTVPLERVEKVQRQLLFNGAVEAVDGTVVTHDTLPVTITQIGVCLVSYSGDQGSWVHRLFRRDHGVPAEIERDVGEHLAYHHRFTHEGHAQVKEVEAIAWVRLRQGDKVARV